MRFPSLAPYAPHTPHAPCPSQPHPHCAPAAPSPHPRGRRWPRSAAPCTHNAARRITHRHSSPRACPLRHANLTPAYPAVLPPVHPASSLTCPTHATLYASPLVAPLHPILGPSPSLALTPPHVCTETRLPPSFHYPALYLPPPIPLPSLNHLPLVPIVYPLLCARIPSHLTLRRCL